MSFMFNPYPYEDLNPVNRPKLPGQVAEGVFVRAEHARVAGQRGQRIERGQHLRRRAFEQAPAAA